MQQRLKVLPESKLFGNSSSPLRTSLESQGCQSFDPSFVHSNPTAWLIIDQPPKHYADQTNNFFQPDEDFSDFKLCLDSSFPSNDSSGDQLDLPRLDSKSSPDSRRMISPSRGSIPFKCPLCNLVCRSQTYLNDHMRRDHSILIWMP